MTEFENMKVLEPQDAQVKQFWGFARDHVGWATLEGIFGQQQASSIEPPWMHLGSTGEEADSLAAVLISEGTIEIETELPLGANEEAVPSRGDLVVVVNSEGRPVSLAATLDVVVSKRVPAAREEAGPVSIVKETLRCLYPKQ